MVRHTATSVVTIERFIIEQERQHPEATGELSGILYDIALAAKMIASKVRMAGLADILGASLGGVVQKRLELLLRRILDGVTALAKFAGFGLGTVNHRLGDPRR